MATRRRLDERHPIFWVHRIGAIVVAIVLWVFGILGFLNHAGFLTTYGRHALGMTSDGLLSTISIVVGVVLVVAAILGGPVASTTCVVVGGLFVLSGLVNLVALLHPSVNLLAFTMPNVIFSLIVGLALLCIGLYGRASGQLPADNPYRRARGAANPMSRIWHGEDFVQGPVDDPRAEERRIEETADMAEAEHAFAEGTATPEQEREVIADAEQRAVQRRQEAWRQVGDWEDTQNQGG